MARGTSCPKQTLVKLLASSTFGPVVRNHLASTGLENALLWPLWRSQPPLVASWGTGSRNGNPIAAPAGAEGVNPLQLLAVFLLPSKYGAGGPQWQNPRCPELSWWMSWEHGVSLPTLYLQMMGLQGTKLGMGTGCHTGHGAKG